MIKPKQQNYLLHWLSGEVETIRGYGIADAVRRAGYGGGAFRALDYWEPEPEEEEAS